MSNGFNETLLKHAEEANKKLQALQKQIAEVEVTGESGAGAVKVKMTGQYYVKKVMLAPNTLTEDRGIVEELLSMAFNDARDKIQNILNSKMMSSVMSMPLPEDAS